MLIFYYILMILTGSVNINKDGAYLIHYKVHVNIFAMRFIQSYMNSTTKKEFGIFDANEKFFNNIFDSINLTLEPYRVQVLGDYSKLVFKETTIKITPDKICQSNNAVGLISNGALVNLAWPKTKGIGNRIIIYKCPQSMPSQLKKLSTMVGECGNLSVFYLHRPVNLIKELTDTIEASLTYGMSQFNSQDSDIYKRMIRRYADRCTVRNETIGHFMKGLVNVRNNNQARISEIEGEHKVVHDH